MIYLSNEAKIATKIDLILMIPRTTTWRREPESTLHPNLGNGFLYAHNKKCILQYGSLPQAHFYTGTALGPPRYMYVFHHMKRHYFMGRHIDYIS